MICLQVGDLKELRVCRGLFGLLLDNFLPLTIGKGVLSGTSQIFELLDTAGEWYLPRDGWQSLGRSELAKKEDPAGIQLARSGRESHLLKVVWRPSCCVAVHVGQLDRSLKESNSCCQISKEFDTAVLDRSFIVMYSGTWSGHNGVTW